jgi:hypothetical protein
MAREDLTAQQVEDMVREYGEGSARQYLAERREELEQEKQAAREKQDYERFVAAFTANGGTKTAARSSYEALRNQRAEDAARAADKDALAAHRSHVRSVL